MYEKLIELINEARDKYPNIPLINGCKQDFALYLADHLIESRGIVVLPCKVGDKTFLLLEKVTGGYDIIESKCVRIVESKYSRIFSMAFACEEIGNTLECYPEDFERWVFLSREDAERALKGGAK
ncbi:MAG: hypothetical protein IIU77_03240 [Clostridia bacterium]|nr:hypothetical protein [Clostridia bacterium]